MTKDQYLKSKGLSLALSVGYAESEADEEFISFLEYILERAHCAEVKRNERKEKERAGVL